jgi:hypothetical protein
MKTSNYCSCNLVMLHYLHLPVISTAKETSLFVYTTYDDIAKVTKVRIQLQRDFSLHLAVANSRGR